MPAAAARRVAARWRPERRPTGRRPDGLLQRAGRTLPDRARDEAAKSGRIPTPARPNRPRASLEIGIGSGLNLPFYGAAVEHIFGLDPSSQLLAMAERRVRRMHEKVTLIEGAAEAIPLEDGASRKVSRACGGRRLWHDGEYQSICNARPQHGAPHVSICIATAPAPLCGLAYNKRSRSEQEPRGLPRCSLAALPIAL